MQNRNLQKDNIVNRTLKSQVRLNLQESDLIHDHAEKAGQSMQLWLRYAVLKACGVEPEPPIRGAKGGAQ